MTDDDKRNPDDERDEEQGNTPRPTDANEPSEQGGGTVEPASPGDDIIIK
ncbi:MAG TPA: hypothetical protein VJT50_08855 [Pyrinomonadaceae bacterium]|nr:hypothetical protein [Pyrinomonadaceae bacterium]